MVASTIARPHLWGQSRAADAHSRTRAAAAAGPIRQTAALYISRPVDGDRRATSANPASTKARPNRPQRSFPCFCFFSSPARGAGRLRSSQPLRPSSWPAHRRQPAEIGGVKVSPLSRRLKGPARGQTTDVPSPVRRQAAGGSRKMHADRQATRARERHAHCRGAGRTVQRHHRQNIR